jgi:hypothetical protein
MQSGMSKQEERNRHELRRADPHQAGTPAIHRRELGTTGGYDTLLRHIKALPEQGCFAPPDGLLGHQGARWLRRRCHHGHILHHEGHVSRQRRRIPPQCDSRPLPSHRRLDRASN